MTINNRIRELRKKSGLTQRELANKVNVSPQVISNWERNYTNPDHDDVKKLSEIFDCSSDYLLGISDNPDSESLNDPAFIAFTNDPELQNWYKELPKSPEDRLRKLKKLWEIIKDEE
ncbi:helix-turn-helix domain-containing protein [Pseudobacillus sp. 179-B 2D1 NHS]|uniref:helix-turn-helix domain-containing protein n=1 Tax=Pseudobacillus sp. 179-B 2D1 NHS TaxID=3374292 RepID=UPI003879DA4F